MQVAALQAQIIRNISHGEVVPSSVFSALYCNFHLHNPNPNILLTTAFLPVLYVCQRWIFPPHWCGAEPVAAVIKRKRGRAGEEEEEDKKLSNIVAQSDLSAQFSSVPFVILIMYNLGGKNKAGYTV